MKNLITAILAIILATLGACRSASPTGRGSAAAPPPALTPVTAPAAIAAAERITGGTPPPAAVAYRTNGDYADNVPVNISADGELTSYPAPGDLRNASPVPLADGYWLDRRGVGRNTVFTRYTYNGYSALPEAPLPDQIKQNIIAGSHVTSLIVLPMTIDEALSDTAAVNAYIRAL